MAARQVGVVRPSGGDHDEALQRLHLRLGAHGRLLQGLVHLGEDAVDQLGQYAIARRRVLQLAEQVGERRLGGGLCFRRLGFLRGAAAAGAAPFAITGACAGAGVTVASRVAAFGGAGGQPFQNGERQPHGDQAALDLLPGFAAFFSAAEVLLQVALLDGQLAAEPHVLGYQTIHGQLLDHLLYPRGQRLDRQDIRPQALQALRDIGLDVLDQLADVAPPLDGLVGGRFAQLVAHPLQALNGLLRQSLGCEGVVHLRGRGEPGEILECLGIVEIGLVQGSRIRRRGGCGGVGVQKAPDGRRRGVR